MATVPLYNGPQVEERALPDARVNVGGVSADAFGGVRARQISQLGQIAQNFAGDWLAKEQRDKERDDAEAVFGLSAQLKKDVIGYESEYRKTRQGGNAKGVAEDTDKFFGELEKGYSEKLTNDRQRRLFGRAFEQQRLSTFEGATRWQDQELERSLGEKWATNKALTIERTVSDPTPQNITSALSEIRATNQFAAANGKHEAGWVELENLKDSTALHTSVIGSMVTRDPSGARAYFEQHKDQIAGSQHEKIQTTIKSRALDTNTQAYAAQVMASGIPLEDAIAKTREKYAGQDEDAYVSRVKEFYGEKEKAKLQNAQDLDDQARKIINKTGSFASVPNSLIERLNEISPTSAAFFLNGRKAEAENASETGVPYAKRDDIDMYAYIEDRISAGDITTLQDLKVYTPFITHDTLKGFHKAIEKREEIPTNIVMRAYEDRGRKYRDSGGKTTEEWKAFKNYIYENVKETKRPEDVEAWADKWFMRGYGVKDSTFSDDPETYGESRMSGRTDFVAETPSNRQPEVNATLAALRKTGLKIPDSTVARDDFYTKYVLDADRWALAHDTEPDPLISAAYAILKQNGKAITPQTVQMTIEKIRAAQ